MPSRLDQLILAAMDGQFRSAQDIGQRMKMDAPPCFEPDVGALAKELDRMAADGAVVSMARDAEALEYRVAF